MRSIQAERNKDLRRIYGTKAVFGITSVICEKQRQFRLECAEARRDRDCRNRAGEDGCAGEEGNAGEERRAEES